MKYERRNVEEDMLKAVREGRPEKVFDVWAHGICFNRFLVQNGIILSQQHGPHSITWILYLDGTDYKTVAVNRTLDGRTMPILRRTWVRSAIYHRLDWLIGKLTVEVDGLRLHDHIISFESNIKPDNGDLNVLEA